jgi:hypothetical protein
VHVQHLALLNALLHVSNDILKPARSSSSSSYNVSVCAAVAVTAMIDDAMLLKLHA